MADLVAERAAGLDAAVAAAVREGAARAPGFAARIADARIDPSGVRGCADLDALPILTKDDMVTAQRSAPPFGGWVAPDAALRRVFCSPGPLYEPQLAGADPWRWSLALRAIGMGPDDVLLNCFSYHLSPAGAMFEEAASAIGATTVPAGVGNLELQVQTAAAVGATAFTGLPSYLKALIDKAASSGLEWTVRRALVTAEPLPDALRSVLTEHVPTVRMAYGTAEAGLLGYEIGPNSGLALPDGVLIQICDLDTGLPRDDDQPGQVVVTLPRPEYPLTRFGTGDLSAWRVGPDGDLRLAGVLGRVGEAVKVRGMFLHPRQAADALGALDGLAGYRFVVGRAEHRDTLRCEIVTAGGADSAEIATAVRETVRATLRLTADVVPVRALPDGPSVLDERDWR
ncbi:MAG: AMP-binding protein [Micromonosporaceae bacterium]|nr:AMP-binding protein [Micromonosporaceae bacterium]